MPKDRFTATAHVVSMSSDSNRRLLAAHRVQVLQLCDVAELDDVRSFDPATLGSDATVGLVVTPRSGADTFAFLRLQDALSTALGASVLLVSSGSAAAGQITLAVTL